jgi:hypothetical protein
MGGSQYPGCCQQRCAADSNVFDEILELKSLMNGLRWKVLVKRLLLLMKEPCDCYV